MINQCYEESKFSFAPLDNSEKLLSLEIVLEREARVGNTSFFPIKVSKKRSISLSGTALCSVRSGFNDSTLVISS